MLINRENMNALFNTYNAAFTAGMQSAQGRPTPEDVVVDDIAMVGRSAGAATIHAWLEQIGRMREWLGERVIENLKAGKLSVTNRHFEKTIAVGRNDIEDDQYGIFTPLFQVMGSNAEANWLALVIDALISNGNWADDAAFFGTTRTLGGNTISNLVTDALSATTFDAGVQAMESYKLYGDEPAEVVPQVLLVGPALRNTAWDIVENQFVSTGTGKGGNKQNPNKGRCVMRVSRRLVGDYANDWYILGTMGGIQGCYVQKRKDPVLTRMDRDTDENVFMRNQYLYGTDSRGEAFLTLPHLIYGGRVSDA